MDLKSFYSLNFLGRIFLSAIFINAIPPKVLNFSFHTQLIVNRGFPQSISPVLLISAIALLSVGSFLMIFTKETKLGCYLLLIFLIPTTIIFHLFPFQLLQFTRNLSLIGGLLVAVDKSN